MVAISGASRLALGTSRLRSASGGLEHEAAVDLLRQALEAGLTFFDTANIYGQGDAERALGDAFATCRAQVVIATKVGYSMPTGAGAARRLKPLLQVASKAAPLKKLAQNVRSRSGGTQQTDTHELLSSVRASLDRLRTDHVDVLYLHNPGHPSEGDRAAALEAALTQGLCRHAGVAVSNQDEASAWLDTGVPTVVQLPAGLGALPPTRSLPTGASLVGREVLSGGQLFNRAWMADQLVELPEDVRPDVEPEASSYLSWLTRQGVVDHVVVGTTKAAHLRELASSEVL